MLVVLCSSCEKEYVRITETEIEGEETIELVNTTIEGNVLDLGALPLSDVLIDLSVDNAILSSTISDVTGKFSFENVPASAERTLLTFRHPILATAYNVLSPQEDVIQYTEMRMEEHSITTFSANETITYSDDLVSYQIDLDQLNYKGTNTIRQEVNTLNESILSTHKLTPTIGITQNENEIILDHQLIFQLDLFDEDGKEIQLIEEASFDLVTSKNHDLNVIEVWYFNKKDAKWEKDESTLFQNASTLKLNKTGLYSLAIPNEAYLFSGIIKDENGEIAPNLKIIIRDEDGNIINETFTNSLGEYDVQVIKDSKGSLDVERNGSIVENISFDNIAEIELSEIVFANVISTCKPLTINIESPACEGELSPLDIFEGDISGLENFTLTINNSNYGVWFSDELFKEIDWVSLRGKTTEYTVTQLALVGESPECTNTITVNDEQVPVIVCTDKVSVKLTDGNAKVWAQDVDNGSFDSVCDASSTLTYSIARVDQCDGECDDDDFKPTIEFTTEDLGATIGYIMKITNTGMLSNSCWGEIIITE